MDEIIINGLELFACHGVNPEEKINGQKFILDITAYLDLSVPCESDNVNDTVSYAKIVKTVRRVFTENKYDLLEKVSQVVADSILSEYSKIDKITVLVKKPDAPVSADFNYMAVKITRGR